MATKIRQHNHSHYTRSVSIDVRRPPELGCLGDVDGLVEATVFSIASSSYDGAAFGRPTLAATVNNSGNPYAFTRAEWEEVKREIDAAWNVYEATWPVDGADAASGPWAAQPPPETFK